MMICFGFQKVDSVESFLLLIKLIVMSKGKGN